MLDLFAVFMLIDLGGLHALRRIDISREPRTTAWKRSSTLIFGKKRIKNADICG
jgi:hypothetical protein